MKRSSTPIRKHFYDLSDPEARNKAHERLQSFKQLASEARRVWKENGFRHILVNQLCLKYTYRKTGELLYLEWRTCHVSELENP